MKHVQKAYKEHKTFDPRFPLRIHRDCRLFYFPPHYHRQLEVIYLNSGVMDVEVNHRTYTLTTGDLMIIGSNHIHSYTGNDNEIPPDYYMMIFDPDHLDALIKDKNSYHDLYPILLRMNILRFDEQPELLSCIKRLMDSINCESQQRQKGYKLQTLSHLYSFLVLAARGIDSIAPSPQEVKALQKENDFISAINDLIYNNYTRELSLPEASEVTGYSPYHFTRLFKKYTGLTYKQYLTNFRINMVKEDLYDETLAITDIAYRHGFSSIKSFNRSFKEITGLSPSKYKKAINDQSGAITGE